MASYSWGRVPQTDEEAAEALAAEQLAPRRARVSLARWAVAVNAVLVLAAVALAIWGTSRRGPLTAKADGGLEQMDEILSLDSESTVHPELAALRNRLRPRLQIEGNLEEVLKEKAPARQELPQWQLPRGAGPMACTTRTTFLFDEVVRETAIQTELTEEELNAYRERFTKAMHDVCRTARTEQEWLSAAGRELEQQKPVMTHALASALNIAGVGFKAEMKQWMLHESASNYRARLGVLSDDQGKKSIMKRGRATGPDWTTATLPENFSAEEKWPECEDAILRIHNQGHCGSCWTFGATASLDARMCIATRGQYASEKDTLSRLQSASCSADWMYKGWDGCQGGWPFWVLDYMANVSGLASTSCIPYYITGEGVEHFAHKGVAPPCDLLNHCQGGYSLSLEEDRFDVSGVENYDWIADMYGDAAKTLAMMTAMYEEGPVSFVFRATHEFMGYSGGIFSTCEPGARGNHAVYASGWGQLDDVPYIQASNSWGTQWGVGGRFKIHPNCVVSALLPGAIDNVDLHEVGDVNLNITRDPLNENWPWKPTDICPFNGTCVTDMGGPDGPYSADEKCISHALDGHKIRVEEFWLEYDYDFLYANGDNFTGWKDAARLDGLVIDSGGITFKSDISIQMSGFMLCIDDQ